MPGTKVINTVPQSASVPAIAATPEQIERAYEVVAEATKAASSNFYYAFITLPSDKRNSVYAGYAFCRLADDIVDDGEYGDGAGEALDSLRVKLADAYDGRAEGDMWIALGDTLHRYPIDRRHLLDVVDGCRMDLDGATYETFDDLIRYCKLVASATGLALIEVFGYEDERAVEYATDLGIALQLINILRDITEDLEIGRVYLPARELAEYGVSVDDLRNRRATPEFRRFMKFQVGRARKYLASGIRLFPLLDSQSRSCPETMVSVYQSLLGQIEKNDYDVLNNRVGLSKFQKLRLLAIIWLRGRGFRFR